MSVVSPSFPVRRIVVKCVNWVGDTILATPTIRALRRRFPGAQITVIARPWVAPLLRTNPDVDAVWEENERGHRRDFARLVARMRAAQFDLGLALPNSFAAALLLRVGRVRRRIGYARDGRSFLLTDPVPVRPQWLRDHEVRYYLNLLSAFGDVPEPPPLVLEENEQARDRVADRLEAEGAPRDAPLVGVNPGAFYGTAKRWASDRFAVVGRRLAQALGGILVVVGTEQERPTAQEVCDVAGEGTLNLAGRVSLIELVSLIKRMAIFVTNDSGAMHVAAVVGVPIVAIFGSTDWVTTPPWSDQAIVVRRDTACAPCLLRHCPIDHRCMERVHVADVVEAIRRRWPEIGL